MTTTPKQEHTSGCPMYNCAFCKMDEMLGRKPKCHPCTCAPQPSAICSNENCDGFGIEKVQGGHTHSKPSECCEKCKSNCESSCICSCHDPRPPENPKEPAWIEKQDVYDFLEHQPKLLDDETKAYTFQFFYDRDKRIIALLQKKDVEIENWKLAKNTLQSEMDKALLYTAENERKQTAKACLQIIEDSINRPEAVQKITQKYLQ